ncbi:MAG: DUF2723 domain-containing protein [Rikenellaceae bacterium]
MNLFKKYNLIIGWLVFAISALVYTLTIEPSASLWDCGEFIATSYKLEVGHPPGAPLFMMLGRLFTMLAPSPEYVGMMANMMSALASAFTILFLFWTITHLARKMFKGSDNELSVSDIITIISTGAIGALAYTFTDTFWFSAVEGEVYALSSLFTALVVWAIFKWENVANEPHSLRWLILIAYFMGLSIGIHLLNLLAIPALVFVYYFKKYPNTTYIGAIKATAISGAILIFVNFIIIPYSVALGAFVDRIFVNTFSLPVNSGITVFSLAVFAALGYGIWKTHKLGKVLANTILLCTTVIMLGYASYASVVIRAAANPPMNSNNPNNPYGLLSLLNRDQYGSRPLLKGPAYSSPAIDVETEDIYYLDQDGKYKKGSTVKNYVYPSEFEFFFPRMYSTRASHVNDYKVWGNVKGRQIPHQGKMVTVPTFGENLRFFFSYQLNFMYLRYFMWNFVGRQSDAQSVGEITDGNWLSGINFIDEIHLGPQENLPSEKANNRGRNRYYFLPFILGLIGMIFHLNRSPKDFTVVLWLFLMLGVVLILYFNSPPNEPRERDYIFAGSFYAFCIWIGLGVIWVKEQFDKVLKNKAVISAVATTVVCASVPVILAAENWDDHDRSHRYFARDVGFNYLQSALPNSIVMNYGDNDTFPLWYNQEVEEVRTDIRVMNMSYLGADWYIDEMKHKYNESEPVPFSMPKSKYTNNNEFVFVQEMFNRPVDIKQAMNFVRSNDARTQTVIAGKSIDLIPAKTLALPVNKQNAIESGIVKAEDYDKMVDTVFITLSKSNLDRGEWMLLDLLAEFDWKRPLYFTQTHTVAPLGLRDYLQFDGYAYRLVPIKTEYKSALNIGRIDTEYLYDKLMNTFRYGNIKDERVYVDYFIQNNLSASQTRNAFARLANQLIEEGDTTRAVSALDRALEEIPLSQIRHSYINTMPIIKSYYKAGETDKANAVFDDYFRVLGEYVSYYSSFTGKHRILVEQDMEEKMSLLAEMYSVARENGQTDRAMAVKDVFDKNNK